MPLSHKTEQKGILFFVKRFFAEFTGKIGIYMNNNSGEAVNPLIEQ